MKIAAIILLLGAISALIAARSGLLGRWLRRAVEGRLGGYRHEAVRPNAALPFQMDEEAPRVAVIGGGLAGIGAASALSERGIDVALFERNPYLGGKVGAWKVPVGDGEQTIEHGFHAFFRQYYNLNRFLDHLSLRESFREIEDYLIIDEQGRSLCFGDIETVPALNILELGRRGFYRWRDVMPKATRQRLDAMVRFDMTRTYEALDDITFGRFCDEAGLPPELRVSFRTFARAFFSDEADLSTADVLRAFHFYYLSHDHGLMYDYPAGDYETTLLAPIRAHLENNGVTLRLGAPVDGIQRGEARRFEVGGEEVDWVVIAADVPGAKKVVEASRWMSEDHPDFVADIRALQTSHGYAVWRIWVDKDVRPGLPTFINVDRKRLLDSVTLYHRITDEARDWAETQDGAVLELHSYALPKDIGDEADIRRVFLEELAYYFPELRELTIDAEALQVRNDFPAFAPGQRKHRPAPKSPVEGVLFAGDWVRLPFPMTHMEAAFTSGLMCANVVFEAHGLRQEPIHTVAPRGLLPPKKAARLKHEAA
jgi:isorenieratene synthase